MSGRSLGASAEMVTSTNFSCFPLGLEVIASSTFETHGDFHQANGESEGIEFKRSTSLLKEAIQTLCAFANHKGGVLYFGVADDGKIIGQTVTDDTLKNVANSIKLNTNPKLYPQVEGLNLRDSVRVCVEQSPLKPHVAYGSALVRQLSS